MPRPIWTGSLSFGLVNVPVKLFAAVAPREVRFHQLHQEDGGRVRLKRVCTKGEHEVPFEEIVKGYELTPEQHVVIRPEELEALDPEATRTVEVEDFVSLDEIDPLFWEHSYYLLPDRGAAKGYALLHQAMSKSRRVAIARMVLRGKQYLCTIRPAGRAMVLATMQYADEIVPQGELEGLPSPKTELNPRELELAGKLIDALTSQFQPEKYRDQYREKVLELVKRKAEGEEIVVQPPAEAVPAKVVSLMDALEASLARAGKPVQPGKERGELRLRQKAARERKGAPRPGKGTAV